MDGVIYFTVLHGIPRTKKNSQQIVLVGKRPIIMPSKAYKKYEAEMLRELAGLETPIDYPINLQCVYYMPTRRKVDLVNLLESTCDILVKGDVLADDHSGIVAGHDGSRVDYDKEDPRVVIIIRELQTDA